MGRDALGWEELRSTRSHPPEGNLEGLSLGRGCTEADKTARGQPMSARKVWQYGQDFVPG